MIGLPPSARGLTGRPEDIAEHASQVAQEWEDVGETYVRKRMKELGIPESQIGQPDYGGDGRWRAFDPHEREGGKNTTGAVVDAGVLNPDLLKGGKGGRIWPRMRLKDRIDAIIAHHTRSYATAACTRRHSRRHRRRNCRSATRLAVCAGRWQGEA